MSKVLSDVAERQTAKAFKDAGVEPPPPAVPKLPGLAGSRSGAQRVVHYAENTLAKRRYFAGDEFSAADIMMHFPLKIGALVATGSQFNIRLIQSTDSPHLDAFPNVKSFLERMAGRPAFQRAMQATMPKGPPAM